jgi:hypothetical protein
MNTIDLSEYVESDDFILFINTEGIMDYPTCNLIKAFKVAFYLNAPDHMKLFGKAIADRLKISSNNGIKEIIRYFNK